jgi:hypothetical protein
MKQTTALGPALARRSHGVSVPGAPMRATLSMRALPPAVARSGQHVGYSPSRGLAGRTPTPRRAVSPVGLSTGHVASRASLRNSTPQRVCSFVKASRMNAALGLF